MELESRDRKREPQHYMKWHQKFSRKIPLAFFDILGAEGHVNK